MSSAHHAGRAIALFGAVTLAAVLVGCSGADEPLVGTTLDQLDIGDKEGALLIYDLSYPILKIDPEYNGGSAKDLWVVVAACGATSKALGEEVPVGVIPTSAYDDDIALKAARGEYDRLLAECAPSDG